MKKLLSFTSLLIITATASAQFNTNMKVEYSKNVGDSFEIYISLPKLYKPGDTYSVVYYCDANLKSGRHLQELIAKNRYPNLDHYIFVGIGHIGNYHVLRRRDFIVPTIKGTDTTGQNKYYGQAERFYAYLQNELVPAINAAFKTNKNNNSIIGHSLGGLFAFYCLFKSDNLFSSYFALSPALWIDNYSIYKFNHIQSGFEQSKYLYFASGSAETINRILKGTNEAKEFLDKKQYRNLKFDYDTWDGQTHNSEVPLSLERILKEKL